MGVAAGVEHPIAKTLGAEVTGVCSTSKIDLVRSLGADHIVDYTTDDLTEGSGRHLTRRAG